MMDTLTYSKTFREEDDGSMSIRWVTYHWGDMALSDYCAVTWRGNGYRVETADNPFDFLPKLSDAVMTLDRYEIYDFVICLEGRSAVEWWNAQQPGLLLALEVKADGTLWAEVWTGQLEIMNKDYDRKGTTTPALALEHWRDIVLTMNGQVEIRQLSTMVGPVGLISEVQVQSYDETLPDTDLDVDVWREI